MRTQALILTAGLLLAAACSSSDPIQPGPGFGSGPVKATINGQAWASGSTAAAVRAANGLYSLTALNTTGDYSLIFTLNNIGATGTYPLGVIGSLSGGSITVSKPGTIGWSTPLSGSAGEIVVSTLSANRIAGTFSFTATPLTGTGNLVVTNGTFDVPVTGTALTALPSNLGGRYSGTINGTPFGANGVAAILTTGTVPILTVTAGGERNIVFILTNMTGAGTYALSATNPIRSVQVTGSPTSQTATWGSQLAGGSGSVVLTTMSSTRIAGTLTATVVPIGGGATGNLNIAATFDFGRGPTASLQTAIISR